MMTAKKISLLVHPGGILELMLVTALESFMMLDTWFFLCQRCICVQIVMKFWQLLCILEQEYIPFILFHRSGVMRSFARLLITLTVKGLSFKAIEDSVRLHRNEYIASLQLKINCLLPQSTSVTEDKPISHVYMPYLSNDLVWNCFLKNFAKNRQFYFHEMASLRTVSYITIDHTFKVAANVGYLRQDGIWITLYNSLFIVLNNIGQVIAWQFTKTTSIDECTELLCALKSRLCEAQLRELYVDNCCNVRLKMQSIPGQDVLVRLDLFHAAQRITKAIRKRHPLCNQVMKDVEQLFRDPKDKENSVHYLHQHQTSF